MTFTFSEPLNADLQPSFVFEKEGNLEAFGLDNTFEIGDQSNTIFTFRTNVPFGLEDSGVYSVTVSGFEDEAGNGSNESAMVSFQVDTTPPAIEQLHLAVLEARLSI